MNREERRVLTYVHRADSSQLSRSPIHADYVDAFSADALGVGANVEEIAISLRIVR